jgi:hypothetical protein
MNEGTQRFWTNNLADGEGRVRSKHAHGLAESCEWNETRLIGIKRRNAKPLNYLLDVCRSYREVLVQRGIQLRRMRKYLCSWLSTNQWSSQTGIPWSWGVRLTYAQRVRQPVQKNALSL